MHTESRVSEWVGEAYNRLASFSSSFHYPRMATLTDWSKRFPKIAQRADFWCIPASIENVLCYRGISTITQEDLILGYCKKFGNDALLSIVSRNPLQGASLRLEALCDVEILQIAKHSMFRHGNFETFAEPVKDNADFKASNLILEFIGNISSKDNYFKAMTDAIESDFPILISVNNGNGTFHIQSVLEVSGSNFRAYDPALNKVESYDIANCVFSNDLLVLKST